MKQIKKTETMMEKLRAIDPDLGMKTLAEFYGNDSQGIWFTGRSFLGEDLTGKWDLDKNGSSDPEDWDIYRVDYALNEKLETFLKHYGWSYEFYDGETVHAFYDGP